VVVARSVAAVYRIDPVSGARTPITQGGLLREALGVTVEGDGNVLVPTAAPSTGPAAFIRVDPVMGRRRPCPWGCGRPGAIALELDETCSLPIAWSARRSWCASIRSRGAQTTVSAGGLFFAAVDARSTDEDVLAADVNAVNFEGAVFRSGSIL
jgi:hypothetical protein